MMRANADRPQGKPANVLIVGDAMLDRYLDGAAERLSPEAPVPVLHVRRRFERPGGAANVAANVTALGGATTLVAVVGLDHAATALRTVLGEAAVCCDALVATANAATTVKTRLLAGHVQIARFDEETAVADPAVHEGLAAALESRLSETDIAVISDYAKGVCAPAVCRSLIDGALRRGIPVIVDPKGRDFSKYSGADVITPNRLEAAAACGFAIHDSADGIRAGRWICDTFGVGAAVVTLGDQGMVVVNKDHVAVIPTQARRVFDVTGAGDTAVAMLAVALGEGRSIADACFLANIAAGLQVAHVGTARIARHEVESEVDSRAFTAQGKVVDVDTLRQAARNARMEGRRIGFTNGCFDILHHGHVALLEAAAKECDLLVVGVNSDASVRRLKGAPRPFVSAVERQAVLAALASVGLVCEFDGDTPVELIRALQPDVLIKGADYHPDQVVGADIVLARGGRVVTPLFVENVSSSRIVDRILATSKTKDPV
jgi:D-beta-D-heptose 7-phosphate kinase/D-beta-D-heptose 1-phosphate adenosyltransferase